MLDIRYIAGALIASVVVIASAIKIFGPADTTTTATATLKPRIEPSRIVEQAAPAAPTPKTAAPAKTQAQPAEVTGSITEPKPAPKKVVQQKKKDEFEFQWPWFKGFGQN